MKPNYFTIFFIFQLYSFSGNAEQNRRILHQPLFPTESSPPPPPVLPPPPPDTDQPFFHELPADPTEQGQQPPQSPANNLSTPNQIPTQQSKPIAKFAIAISSTVVILGVLSVIGFVLYKRCLRRSDESQKLVNGNLQRTGADSRTPPASTFLYIGTVEPSTRSIVNEDSNNANGSPYRKLNSGKRSDRYRPSPELQPLPPLRKPIPPPVINSPPPMSSSDDESNDTGFYTPHGSSKSNESTSSRLSVSNSLPHSRRTSRKSRITVPFSPDNKPVMIPAIKQAPPPSPPPPPARPKFSAPPPPPDMARLRLISSYNKTPPHPPPPPPPPPMAAQSALRKAGSMEINNPLFVSNSVVRTQTKSYSPTWAKSTPKIEKALPISEGNKKVESSLERADSWENDGSKPRLKPLHWDKVRATSERATVWDQLTSSSFQVNEDAIESLFGCNSTSVPKEGTRKSLMPSLEKENRVLDPKKSQNIAILLRALNVTTEEVTEALLDGNPEGLGPELLETLVKMAPTKEEEIKLKDYNGEISKLGSAERFLKSILDNIPFAFKRVEAMLYRANFDTEVNYLRKSFQTLEEASEELKNSRLFLKLLEAVLRTGNRMNDGTNRGDARAFKLDTLLKLVDVKGTDGRTTLLHFVVQEIIRSEGAGPIPANEIKNNVKLKEEEFKKQGLQVVLGLSKEIGNVKRAAGMDSDVLSSYVSKLEMGLEKVSSVLQYEKNSNFFVSMKEFLTNAGEEISRVKAEERKALSLVKDATQYFHGDAMKEEAHPFRIFMIVRDFLSVLDNVCKDVGRMQDRTTMGAGRAFRIPASASLPVLNRYNVRNDSSSEGDSM